MQTRRRQGTPACAVGSRVVALGVLCAFCSGVHADHFLVTDWAGDRVMLLDDAGVVVDADFITSSAQHPLDSPREAIQVDDQIWVSDQSVGAVYRFTLADPPVYIGQVTPPYPMDSPRGMAVLSSRVYLAHAGFAGGAPGDVIVPLGFDGEVFDFFSVGDGIDEGPTDVVAFGDDLLVSAAVSFPAIDDVIRYGFPPMSGVSASYFHQGIEPSGIDFPQQIAVTQGGTVLVGGLSSPRGVYEFSASGLQIDYISTGTRGVRGVATLDDGSYLITTSPGPAVDGGLHIVDPATDTITDLLVGPSFSDLSFISRIELTPPCDADFNNDGAVTVGDILDYLSAWSLGTDPRADTNKDGNFFVGDILDWIQIWAAGCP